MAINGKIVHQPQWNTKELEIVYSNYKEKTIFEIKKLLPNRTLSAVKNKVKAIKYGKYRKKR